MNKLDTLLDAFAPPEGMIGHSCALVAMTGEENFLDEVMQRFTRLRARQRSQLGIVTTFLMLDPHGSSGRTGVFPPGRIPGLHELTPRSVDSTSLLHAKLGLLAFSNNRVGAPVRLRLVVMTANFTYASAKQQLELVWTLDVPIEGASPAEERADIFEAAKFVRELLGHRFYRDEEALPAKQRRLTARFDDLLDAVERLKESSAKPRFIHSLTKNLYDQIRAAFERKLDSRRNLLLCGFGFYEEPSDKPRKPAILSKLEALDVFTSNVSRVALVEPNEAGAVATWAKTGNTDGWTISRPTDALGRNRSLHAKFVYSGYLRDGHISNGWLYLGSGNLSRRGLLTTAAMTSGNIECGVVLGVPERIDVEGYLAHYLFWWPPAPAIKADEWRVGRVGDAPEGTMMIMPSPILSGAITASPTMALRLEWREDVPIGTQVDISWPGHDWTVVPREQPTLDLDPDQLTPIALRIRDRETGNEWTVPVVDASGRVSWQPPKYETFEDVLAALLDFPIRPADETSGDDEEIDDDTRGGDGRVNGKATDEVSKTYSLHAAAELLEKTAALQRALEPGMLDDWFEHLDRMFRASFPESLVAAWRSHGINVFAHLREIELRPQAMTDKQRATYFAVLDRAALKWGMS